MIEITFKAFQLLHKDKHIKLDSFKTTLNTEFPINWSNDLATKVSFVWTTNKKQLIIIESSAKRLPYNKDSFDFKECSECKTPRTPHKAEFKDHYYYVINFETSIVWICDIRRTKNLTLLLSEYESLTNIILKNIFDKETFLNSIQKLNQIKFAVKSNSSLFESDLSAMLKSDPLMYGSESIELNLSYKDLSKTFFNKLGFNKRMNKLIDDPNVTSLIICGRDEKGNSLLFNPNIMTQKHKISVKTDELKQIILDDLVEKVEEIL